MEQEKRVVVINGIKFTTLLGLLFIGLKLGNVITWSWWLVLLPIYGPAAAWFAFILAGGVLTGIIAGLVTLIRRINDKAYTLKRNNKRRKARIREKREEKQYYKARKRTNDDYNKNPENIYNLSNKQKNNIRKDFDQYSFYPKANEEQSNDNGFSKKLRPNEKRKY